MAIKIRIGKEEEAKTVQLDLNAIRTLDGNVLVKDHPMMDIVIMPQNSKILTLAKENINSDEVYEMQNSFFRFLRNKGVVSEDNVQGGNVYASMEALYETENPYNGVNPENYVLFYINEYMLEERPHLAFQIAYEDKWEDSVTEPPADETTPLGKVPQEPKKGSIPPDAPYWWGRGAFRVF